MADVTVISLRRLSVLALLATASAFGQTTLRYDIPFEFHFLDQVMPAGQYDVNVGGKNMGSLLSLDCDACRAHAHAVAHGIGGGIADVPGQGRLVFNKYGDTYFLSEVWAPGYALGRALFKSKTESESARTTPDVARIILPARTSHVTIARR